MERSPNNQEEVVKEGENVVQKKSSLTARIISGIVYAALMLGMFLLKVFVSDLFFDGFVWFFAIVGTFEMTRAFEKNITKVQRVMVFIFAVVVIPACALAELWFGYGLHVACVCFFALCIFLLSLLVFRHEETTLENIGAALLSAVYPALLLCLLVLVNHIGEPPLMEGFDKFNGAQSEVFNSNLAIVLIFLVSPISDVFAFFTGISLKKVFPKKLAPTLSPNKTIVGFIGGLLGGVVAAVVAFFGYNFVLEYVWNMNSCLSATGLWLPIYMAIGLFAALATCFGDLVESCIKRKKGLKDMGKIMPGHGGVLDRIDGTIFAAIAVYLCFVVIHLFL